MKKLVSPFILIMFVVAGLLPDFSWLYSVPDSVLQMTWGWRLDTARLMLGLSLCALSWYSNQRSWEIILLVAMSVSVSAQQYLLLLSLYGLRSFSWTQEIKRHFYFLALLALYVHIVLSSPFWEVRVPVLLGMELLSWREPLMVMFYCYLLGLAAKILKEGSCSNKSAVSIIALCFSSFYFGHHFSSEILGQTFLLGIQIALLLGAIISRFYEKHTSDYRLEALRLFIIVQPLFLLFATPAQYGLYAFILALGLCVEKVINQYVPNFRSESLIIISFVSVAAPLSPLLAIILTLVLRLEMIHLWLSMLVGILVITYTAILGAQLILSRRYDFMMGLKESFLQQKLSWSLLVMGVLFLNYLGRAELFELIHRSNITMNLPLYYILLLVVSLIIWSALLLKTSVIQRRFRSHTPNGLEGHLAKIPEQILFAKIELGTLVRSIAEKGLWGILEIKSNIGYLADVGLRHSSNWMPVTFAIGLFLALISFILIGALNV